MFLPEITRPPSACSAIPPTPRRLGTMVSTAPSGRRQYTPPFVTSLKYRFPAPSTRGPSISPYPYASVSNRMLLISIFPSNVHVAGPLHANQQASELTAPERPPMLFSVLTLGVQTWGTNLAALQ